MKKSEGRRDREERNALPTVEKHFTNTRKACFKSNILKPTGCSPFTEVSAGACPGHADTGFYFMCELQNLKHHELTNCRNTSPRWGKRSFLSVHD